MNIRPDNIDFPAGFQLHDSVQNLDYQEEIWKLANRLQQLQRSNETMRGLLHRALGGPARSITLGPHLEHLGDTVPTQPAPRTGTWPEDPWWPRGRLPETPLKPLAGHLCYGLSSEDARHTAVSMIGLRGADLEAALADLGEMQIATGDFKPVILTDAPDWPTVMRRGWVTEHLTARQVEQGADEDAGVPAPIRALLERKWDITNLVDMRAVRASGDAVELCAPAPTEIETVQQPRPSGRKRAAVVCWDLGHNPAGRAMVLYDLLDPDYDVELVGPLWSRYGSEVWAPIRESSRKVRSFACNDLEEFWPSALALAADADYDLVVVCKPRLPSLVLGALIKQTCGCPLVLDIDDFELSYFSDDRVATLEELEQGGTDALAEPYMELATRACEGLIADADARIVSNVALRGRYGGTIVRHARDEHRFDRHRYDRAWERRALGMRDDDFALMFVGTARAHKGLFQVAETLATLGDDRFVLHLVGDIPDLRVKAQLDSYGARVVYHPGCAFDDLPRHLVAADAVVLMQDPDHPVSQYQIPAKISDAAALGLPILCTDVAPVRDIALQGLLRLISPENLGTTLLDLIEERDRPGYGRKIARIREAFEMELGLSVNRRRIGFAATRAGGAGSELPRSYERLIDVVGRGYAALREARRAPAPAPPPAPGWTGRGLLRRLRRAPDPFDVVMFWKQNDSGLYGRRSDMVMRHLLASGRVRKVLQFDAPVEVQTLSEATRVHPDSPDAHVLRNAVDNQFGLRDSDTHILRTFLWDGRDRPTPFPRVGAALSDYPDFVAAQMERAGIRPENALAWVYPVVFDFPAVAARIPFRAVIGDLVDDQRTFAMQSSFRERIAASYDETVPLFDLTFTNCNAMAEAFGPLAGEVHVVPNGTDRPAPEARERPDILAGLPRPIAGYVGNLRDRIDWDLLAGAAAHLPEVTFAIVGGGERAEDTARLAGLPNVVFTGMVPHDQVSACLDTFDVAIVPHLETDQTRRMNPLKIYNYFAARRPIVSTRVENIDADLARYIRFADDARGFADAISAALRTPMKTGRRYEKALNSILWEKRARSMLDRIDRMHRQHRRADRRTGTV